MPFSLSIVNSYVYIYGEGIQRYKRDILEHPLVTGKISEIDTRSDKLLINLSYKKMVLINSVDDVIDYIKEFLEHVDDVIFSLEEDIGMNVDSYSVSNIVFSGQLVNDDGSRVTLDLHALKLYLLSRYGDRIIYCDKPISNGNEFAGLIVTMYINPTKLSKKGNIIKKKNKMTFIIYSNGKFIWTGINDTVFSDLEGARKKLAFFVDLLEEIRKFKQKKISIDEIIL